MPAAPNPRQGPPSPWTDPPDRLQPEIASCPTLPVKADHPADKGRPRASAHTPLPLPLGVAPDLSPSPWSPHPRRLASGPGAEATARPVAVEAPGDQCPPGVLLPWEAQRELPIAQVP